MDQDDVQTHEDEFTTVISAGDISKKSVLINPYEIDAFWTQREVSKHYSDPLTAQQKATAAMKILESHKSIREAENDLMELFDYEKFELVKLLTQNRDTILWCTRLKLCETDEDRLALEQQIKNLGLGWILNHSIKSADENKDYTGATMDIDKKEEDADMEPVKPTLDSQPKQTVDLKALAFEQGGHFMSNKKVKLPEGSFKRSQKGYEEVHVPPPKVEPMKQGEKLREISSLPQWAQPGFIGAQSLNRIQSRVFSAAFESDENMLLCAPTGAGK